MKEKDMIISKSDFLWIMGQYERQKEKIEAFNDALDKICDGYPVFDPEDGYLNALLFTLKKSFGIQTNNRYEEDTLEWYLFESPRLEDGKRKRIMKIDDVEVDVQGYDMLYDLLVAEYCSKNGDETVMNEFLKKYGKNTKEPK